MPRDYRQPTTPMRASQKRKQNRSCVWWFLMGTGLGVLASNILGSRTTDTVEPGDAATKPPVEEQQPRVAPNFRFQEILSDDQVDLSNKPPPPPPPAERPTPPKEQPKPAEKLVEQPPAAEPTPPPAETVEPRKGGYILQVGSLSRESDAERLKAQLALLGISTSIQKVTLANGRTTHRVRTGAYASKQDMEKVRALLKRNGKDSLAISIK